MEPPLIDLKLSTKRRLFMMKIIVGICIFSFALGLFQIYMQLKTIQYSTAYLRNEVGSLTQEDVSRIEQLESNSAFIIDMQLVVMACLFVVVGSTAYILGKYSKPPETTKADA
jgi:uncharacterized membrane protein